ncbi:MAG TPA: HAMP domain-containing sensor histidine kinase [Terriglobales bacterium]|nr:HAMP domain-containing sensor histidine kinase [Terriglobales bacterium]
MLRSLRAQLSLSILFVLLVTVALISVLSNWLINREFARYIIRQEEQRSESIVSDLASQYGALSGGWNENFLHTVGMYSLYDGYLLKIYDASGAMLWDAENHDMTLCSQIMGEISQRMEGARRQGGFVTNTYAVKRGAAEVGSVSITYYGPFFFTENDYLFLKTLNLVLLGAALLSSLFAVAAGTLLARRISRPIAKTAYIATQIAQGNYDIRFEGTPATRELLEMTAAINHLTEALSEQEKLRRRLTSDVAHELRTPLSAVGAHLEAMLEGIWEPTPERLQNCHDEIKRLGALVSELERLSKIEDGNLKLNKERVDLYELGRAAVQNFERKASEKALSLSLEGGPAYVEADRERILQVVMDLLSNAINYTPEGGHVHVRTSTDGQNGCISVADDGIGISEEELPFIFERFYRTDRSRSRKTGGTGIGLTIAKSIVEAHGGTIEAESAPGAGSCFTVRL